MDYKKVWRKIKRIPIIGVPYDYFIGSKRLRYKLRFQTKEIQENGMDYLQTVEKTLENSSALFYTYAGTLLGIIREKKLISWDVDIDYAVVITDEFTWDDLQHIMNKSGFEKVREFEYNGKVTEQTYKINNLKIDFFGQFYCSDNEMIQYSYDKLLSVDYNSEEELSVFEVTLPKVVKSRRVTLENGIKVSVPDNAEEILCSIYNENWRVPNPNWKSNSGKCSKLLEGELGYITLNLN